MSRVFLGLLTFLLVCELSPSAHAGPKVQSLGVTASAIQTSADSGLFLQSPRQAGGGPLARGIADIQTRINRNRQLADALRDAVADHVENIGEFIYAAYGQKEDPGRRLVELKKAYEDVHTDVVNGLTGQVWQALGQLGQALLDCASDSGCLPAPQYQVGQNVLKGINVLQQIGWESARLETTLSELNSYTNAILRDTKIEESLEDKNADLTLPLTDDPVLPSIPSGVDLSALDDAVLMDRWLDLGNRAFAGENEEQRFYAKFPAFQQFRKIADSNSPLSDVERLLADCAVAGKTNSASGAVPQGAPPPNTSMAQQIAGVGAFLRGVNKRSGCPQPPPK